MRQGWKITVVVLAAAAVVSTPLVWLLNGPDAGQLAGASVQAAVGVAALLWALFQSPDRRTDDTAVRTGQVRAGGGGTGVSGIRRPGGEGSGSARAERTGPVTAHGDGSRGVSGIDYTG
ncbi:hypothetical protein ACFY4K_31510 [Streptomyces leeuwenhoekii]|jgi:hypothetical protein|uniref:hypothetical protein n=1 Tax=Streptomyces leeuwenhoekii TaxID=1437453 RepID=UPI0036A7D56E